MNVSSTTFATRLFARDDDGGSSKLSTASIIVIVVVCACVGLLILALFLWRLIVRFCRPSTSAPLPPVQELAHRRGQELVEIAQRQAQSRPITWLDGSLGNHRGSRVIYSAGSTASLLPGTPERKSSVRTDGGITAESSPSISSPEGPPLYPPNPAFFGASWDPSNSPHNSFISTRSSGFGASVSSLVSSPSPSAPLLESESSTSHITTANSNQPLYSSTSYGFSPRPIRGRSSSRRETHSRRLSVVSSIATTHHSVASRASVIHGAPHSPHSNIQIVLPAPLAVQSLEHNGSANVFDDRQSARTSVFADQWLTSGSRHASDNTSGRRGSHARRRPSSQPPPRKRLHRKASSDQEPPSSSPLQRSSTQPRAHSRPQTYTPPPIPRIPEGVMYDVGTTPPGPGRSVTLRPMSSMPVMQPHGANQRPSLPPHFSRPLIPQSQPSSIHYEGGPGEAL